MADQSRLEIVVDSRGAERNVRNVRNELGQLERGGVSSIANLRSAALGLAGVFTAIGATQFFRSVIDEQEQLQRNMLRTQQLLETTGRTGNRSAESLLERARAINDATLNSTEGVMQAQQTLLTFRNITGDVFDRAIDGAVDLAAAMGTDLNSATLQLAKALEDPVTGMTALTRSGTVFTKAQKEMVKGLVETGRAAEAQGFILDELAAQYGGVAAREAEGLAGAQDALTKAMQEGKIAIADYLSIGDRAERTYRSLAGGVNSFAGALRSGDLDGHINTATDAMKLMAVIAGGRLAGSLGTAAGAKLTATAAAIRYQAALASMAGVSRTAAAAQLGLAGAVRGASGAMALLGGPAGVAALAVIGIVAFREELGLVPSPADRAREALDLLSESITDVNDASLDGAMIQLNAQMFELERQAREAREQLDRINSQSGGAGVLGFEGGQTGARARAEGELGNVNAELGVVRQEMERIQALKDGLDNAGEAGDGTADALDRLGTAADDLAAKFKPMLDDDIESILERAGPGASIDESGQIRDAFGNFLPTMQRDLESTLRDQFRAFTSEQNLMAGLERAAEAIGAGVADAIASSPAGLMATNSQDSAPGLAKPPSLGTMVFKLEGKDGQGGEVTVEGRADDLRRMADVFSGVASAS